MKELCFLITTESLTETAMKYNNSRMKADEGKKWLILFILIIIISIIKEVIK